MSATTIRFRAKVLNPDPSTNPDNGYVEGFYYQDLDNGVLKHYIFNCPMTWEVNPATVRIIRHDDLPIYKNPITKLSDIRDLQRDLVACVIAFIRRRKLKDIDAVRFNIDGLEESAIKYGCWTPDMDSYICAEGLQEDDGKDYRVRKEIGEYM
jgi:hypothetical protein